MKEDLSLPVYSQIALDIAMRISRGELKEKTKIYGRSVMSSEYGVSPETIRRALKLLADMGVVDIRHNSGTVILSSDKAKEYVARANASEEIRSGKTKLKELLVKQEEINRQILDAVREINRNSEKFSKTNPFRNYEIIIPPDSPTIGKTLGELRFWQKTGATIIAIRRRDKILLSPGPYAAINALDMLIFVGNLVAIDTVDRFIHGEFS